MNFDNSLAPFDPDPEQIPTAGPLARAYRELRAAQATLIGFEERWHAGLGGVDQDVMDAAIDRLDAAMEAIVRAIAAAARSCAAPVGDRLIANVCADVAAAAVESGRLYLLVHAEHGGQGQHDGYRPVALDLGGLL